MFGLGPQPPRELLDDLPEDIPVEAGASAWSKGFLDGSSNREYKIFENEPDIQPLYKDGYDRGKANIEIRDMLAWEEEEPEEKKRWHPSDWVPKRLHRPMDFVIYSDDFIKTMLCWLGAIYLLIRIGRSLVGKD